MADKEWYKVSGISEPFNNLESAYSYAEAAAEAGSNAVEVTRCTETVVRRYRRTVTVVAEDVTPQA
jgi:hypothetical protein